VTPSAAVPVEPPGTRWGRRALTIPGLGLATAAWLALLPLLLAAALLGDVARGAHLAATRAVLLLGWYLLLESLGLVGAACAWLARPFARSRFADWNFRLQCAWAGALFTGARALLGLRLDVTGTEALTPGPLLLLMRHASVADTLLPAVLVSRRTGCRLRYVMKRELLWDPCLDVVGQRLPNAFVRRGTGDAAEQERVRVLATHLGPDEGVLLYPEGTRWTPGRRRQVIDRLARSADPKLLERAQALQWLLPPRLGGVLALLEAAPGTDVVFCAHTGFEGLRSLGDLLHGALVARRIQVHFRRVPAAEIPRDRKARVDWIYARWAELDAWLEAHVGPAHPGGGSA
jgi:1-acyl-sn-glycerol-3-phosphate acyltransferase